MVIYVASVNGSTSAEKFHKGKSETNFPLTILIRMVGGLLQFVGAIHNYGWDMYGDMVIMMMFMMMTTIEAG